VDQKQAAIALLRVALLLGYEAWIRSQIHRAKVNEQQNKVLLQHHMEAADSYCRQIKVYGQQGSWNLYIIAVGLTALLGGQALAALIS
jgi:hypothetical protein